jgi:hypothetical protein
MPSCTCGRHWRSGRTPTPISNPPETPGPPLRSWSPALPADPSGGRGVFIQSRVVSLGTSRCKNGRGAYAKAYRGFQKGLSPRVAARARYLTDNPTVTRVVLAPLYCLGYFDTRRRKQTSMITLIFTMAGLILLVRLLEQPWRGIIDSGIAAGLA